MQSNKYTLSNFRNIPISTNEEISKLQFDSEDVLIREEDIRVRRTNLDKAISLARSEKFSTSIIVKAAQNLFRIESTVLSIDNGFVVTKSGLKIPLNCIYSADFHSN
jgi:hypothetical protein